MKKVALWVVLIPLFTIPFLALWVADGSLLGFFQNWFFPFITGKNFMFRMLVEVAFFGWVLLAFLDAKYRPRFSWTAALYTALVVWMFIADLFAVNPHKAFWSNFERMDGYVTLIHVFMLFVVAGSVLEADKLWKKWWQTFLIGSTLILGYCLMQLAHWIPIHQGGARVDGTLGNAAYLAAYLLFVVAIAVWQGLESKGWMRNCLFALAGLQAIVLYLTATRGAILALLGAVVLAALVWMAQAGKKGRMYAGVALVGVLVIVGGFFALRNSDFVQHDPTLARFASISSQEGTTRFTLWHMALQGAEARPITGWGQDGFNYVFNTYYEPSLFAQEPWFDRAHNIFIDWMIAGGFPALLLFIGLLGAAAVALMRSGGSRSERILLTVALAAYAFQGIFVFDNLFTYVPLAVILAMAHARSSKPIPQLEGLSVVEESASMLASGLAVTAVIVLWIVNVPSMQAAGDLLNALSPASSPAANVDYFKTALSRHSFGDQEIREQLVTFVGAVANNQSVSQEDKNATLQFAFTEVENLLKEIPKDARVHLEAALVYRMGGDFKNALAQEKLAESESPRKQSVLIEEGITLWQSGDIPGARDVFNRAYQLDPEFADLALYAAAGDIGAGNLVEGKKLLMSTNGTTTIDNGLLILAYYQAKDFDDLINSLELRVRTHDSSQERIRLIAAYKEAGRLDEARRALHELVAKYPETSAAAASYLQQIGG